MLFSSLQNIPRVFVCQEGVYAVQGLEPHVWSLHQNTTKPYALSKCVYLGIINKNKCNKHIQKLPCVRVYFSKELKHLYLCASFLLNSTGVVVSFGSYGQTAMNRLSYKRTIHIVPCWTRAASVGKVSDLTLL